MGHGCPYLKLSAFRSCLYFAKDLAFSHMKAGVDRSQPLLLMTN
jgi:hypothetical protein